MTWRVLLTGLALLASGCIALPYATPPIEYAGSIGVTSQTGDARLAVPVRATIYPAGLAAELYDRNWELGAGYVVLMPIDAPLYHGPYGEIGYYEVYPIESGPLTPMWRVGVRGSPTVVFRDAFNDPSIGGAVRLVGEYVSFAEGPYSDCSESGCSVGYAYGETSAGLYAEASHLFIDAGVTTLSFGILVRAPATAGILLGWLLQ